MAFMNLEKACNKICREESCMVLHECVVDWYLISSMSSLYDGSRACVRLGGTMGKYFEVRRGLRQEYVMSPLLFNIFPLKEWLDR